MDHVEKGKVVNRFDRAICGNNIGHIVEAVRDLLAERAWDGFVFIGMAKKEHNVSLGQFLTAEPTQGLGFKNIDAIDTIVKKACDPELYAQWRDAMTAPAHRPVKKPLESSDNVTTYLKAKRGNSQSYTLSRLKRERPDLFEHVKAKKLSANAAAIEAGFRRKLTPDQQALKLLPKMSKPGRRKLWQQLNEEFNQ